MQDVYVGLGVIILTITVGLYFYSWITKTNVKLVYDKILKWINKLISRIAGGIAVIILILGFLNHFETPELKNYLINLIILSLSLGSFLILLFPLLRQFKKNLKDIELIGYFLYAGLYFIFGLLTEPFSHKNLIIFKENVQLNSIVTSLGLILFGISIFLAVISFIIGIARLFMISSNISNKVEEFNEKKHDQSNTQEVKKYKESIVQNIMKFRMNFSEKQKEMNRQHIMNYAYSYFAGLLVAIAMAFILGQEPLKYHWLTVLVFLVITFFAGFLSCSIIFFGLFHISKIKKLKLRKN